MAATRYALVNKRSKIVENTIMYDPNSNWQPSNNHTLVPAENNGGVGDIWNGTNFIKPAPSLEPKLKTQEDYKIEYNDTTTLIDRKLEIQAALLGLRDPEPVS